MPKTIDIEMPESAFSALRRPPDEFARKMRLAAAATWHEMDEDLRAARGEVRRGERR